MCATRWLLAWSIAVLLDPLLTSPTLGQEWADAIAVGTIVCADREAADDLLAIMQDPDADVARQLVRMLSSGGCSDRLTGERYEPVALETSGVIKARLRLYLTVYLFRPAA